MLYSNVTRKDRGFTLLEQLIILIVVGLLGATSAPNFLALYNRYKLNQALNRVRGALLEAQRQAMRRSQLCEIKIDATNQEIKVFDSNSNGCLLETRDLDGIIVKVSSAKINFGIRGNTTTNKTIKLSIDGVGEVKCLSLSMPLGIMRTGIFESGTCKTS